MLLEIFQSVVISYIPVLHMKTVLERLLFRCNMANYSNLQTQGGLKIQNSIVRHYLQVQLISKELLFLPAFVVSEDSKGKIKMLYLL